MSARSVVVDRTLAGAMNASLPAPKYFYRALVRGATGKTQTFVVIEAVDDEDAITQAYALTKGCPAEVWNRTRMVAKINPAPLPT